MNSHHIEHAWQHRHGDRLCPHALAFLYAHPDPSRRGRFVVSAATRLWLDEPEARDLPRLLFGFRNIIASEVQTPGWDVRREHANRVDEQMARSAVYCGIGVSSLDTYSGTWEQACQQALSPASIPGRILILLTDGTRIVGERRAVDEFNAFHIHSTHTLDLIPGHRLRLWSWVDDETLRKDDRYNAILRWLEALNDTLWPADNARIVAKRHNGGRRSSDGR